MAIISSYPVQQAKPKDYLTGTSTGNVGTQINQTKNFVVQQVVEIGLGTIPAYQDNVAALAGGLVPGQLYQTDGLGVAPLNAAGIVMIVQ